MLCFAVGVSAHAQQSCSAASLGDLGALNGWVPSPNDAWHQDISAAPVDPNSATIVSASQDLAGAYLHPDFSTPANGGYGIPYTVVDASTMPLVSISPSDIGDSDNTLYPLSSTTPIEGNPGQCWSDSNDHHAIVIDRNQCVAYEVFQADLCNGSWSSYGNVVWDFNTTEQRPYGLSSTDAAGLSIFEGLLRYDEIVAGSINHALRFTAMHTKADSNNGYFTAPATHAAGNLWGTDNVMGMRIRLKANFDISGYSSTNQIILTAMKKYGMILADNGSNMFFQGTPDPRWNDNDIHTLTQIPATAFEVVQMGPVYDSASAPTGPLPVINSFTASSTSIAAGSSVTLTSNVSGANYQFISNAGFTRGSVTVTPSQTTTYVLTARNQFGTSTASVTVNVGSGTSFSSSTSSTTTTSSTPTTTSTSTTPTTTTTSSTPTTTTTSSTPTTTTTWSTPTTTTTAPPPPATVTPTITLSVKKFKHAYEVIAVSNSTGTITYSVVSGQATVSGNMIYPTSPGSITVLASQAPAGNYSAGSATISFSGN